MGELTGIVDGREGTIAGNAFLPECVHLLISGNLLYLCNFRVDSHKYVQAYAVGYDKCDFSPISEADKSLKRMVEEKNA